MDSKKLYKIMGNPNNGMLACGHRIKKNEYYFIEVSKNAAYAKCRICADKYTEYKVIQIPQDLIDGAIPI